MLDDLCVHVASNEMIQSSHIYTHIYTYVSYIYSYLYICLIYIHISIHMSHIYTHIYTYVSYIYTYLYIYRQLDRRSNDICVNAASHWRSNCQRLRRMNTYTYKFVYIHNLDIYLCVYTRIHLCEYTKEVYIYVNQGSIHLCHMYTSI